MPSSVRPLSLMQEAGSLFAEQYEIVRQLGQGGMGTVFLANDIELERSVAIKVLQPSLSSKLDGDARFRREARLLSRLSHPNIVVLHAFGTVPGTDQRYIVMEYVAGHTLDTRLAYDALDRPSLCHVLSQIGSAISEAHRQGVVHRDLKPANVLLTRVGDEPCFVKVVDFGLAKVFTEGEPPASGAGAVTVEGTFLGTPIYMAPEQFRAGPVDGRADQYALGVMATQLLTGQLPFEATDFPAVLVAHLHDPPRLPSSLRPGLELPPAVDEAIARALSKSPADRYASVADFMADLLGALYPWAGLAPALRPSGLTRAASIAPSADTRSENAATAPTIVSGIEIRQTQPPLARRAARSIAVVYVTIDTEVDEATLDRDEQLDCLSLVALRVGQAVRAARGIVVGPLSDRVVAVFGTEANPESEAERAVDAALALRRALVALVDDPSMPGGFRLRFAIGVDAGRLSMLDAPGGSVVCGPALTEARRLAEGAAPATIQASAAALRRVRGLFDVVVDKERGVGVVRGRRSVPRELRAPEIHGVRIDLVGRDAELDVLLRAVADVSRERRARLVVVRGAAGVGKSRLVAELLRRLDDASESYALELGRSSPGDGAPYQPFVDALRTRARIQDADAPEQARFKLEHHLHRLGLGDAPWILEPLAELLGIADDSQTSAPVSSRSEGGERRLMIFRAFAEVIRASTQKAPVVFVLEELQWATGDTRALLRHLLAALVDVPVLFVAVGRPPEAPSGHGASSDQSASPSRDGVTIELKPLDAKATEALVRHALRAMVDPPVALVRAIVALAEGSPLLVEETVHDLFDRGVLVADADGRWRLTTSLGAGKLPLPESVERLFLSRVEQLAPGDREVLEAAAVAGRRSVSSLLAELLPGVDVGAAVGELSRRGLVVLDRDASVDGERSLAFAQLAVREAVYPTVPRPRRVRLHRAIALWMEQRARTGGSLTREDAIAAHFRAGGEPARAFPYELRAAERAVRVSAVDEAVVHLGQCLTLLDEIPADDMPVRERRALRLRLRAELVHQCVALGDLARAVSVADAVLDEPPAEGDGLVRARVTVGKGQALEHLGRYADARAVFARGRELATAAGSVVVALMAVTGEASMAAKLGGTAESAALLSPVLERDDPSLVGAEAERALSVAYRVLANAQLRLGHHELAETAYRRAYDLSLSANAPVSVVDSLNGLAALHYYQGDLQEAESTWRLALSTAEQRGLVQHRAILLNNLGELEWKRGATAQAVETLTKAVHLHESMGSDEGLADTRRVLAECSLALGHEGEASAHVALALEAATRIASPYFVGACHRTLAKVAKARGDAAGVALHLRQALASFEDARLRGEVDETLALWRTLSPGDVPTTASLSAFASVGVTSIQPGISPQGLCP